MAGVPDIKESMDQDQQLKKSSVLDYISQQTEGDADDRQTSTDVN